MSYSRARALAACDFSSPAAPSSNVTDPAAQKAASDAASRDQQIAAKQAHDKAIEPQTAYASGIRALNASWSKLPMDPYPPASDMTGFPRTGDQSLILDRSAITAAQLAEPGRVTAGMLKQSIARRPQLSPLFWVGLACLGVGIYVARH